MKAVVTNPGPPAVSFSPSRLSRVLTWARHSLDLLAQSGRIQTRAATQVADTMIGWDMVGVVEAPYAVGYRRRYGGQDSLRATFPARRC